MLILLGLLFIAMGLCGMAGVIWICVIAIQNDEVAWGILSLFCGIVAIVYALQNFDQCKIPLVLLLVGIGGGFVSRFVLLIAQ